MVKTINNYQSNFEHARLPKKKRLSTTNKTKKLSENVSRNVDNDEHLITMNPSPPASIMIYETRPTTLVG